MRPQMACDPQVDNHCVKVLCLTGENNSELFSKTYAIEREGATAQGLEHWSCETDESQTQEFITSFIPL